MLACSITVTALVQAKFFNIINNPQHAISITTVEQLLDSGLPIIFADALTLLFIEKGLTNRRIFRAHISTNLTFTETIDDAIHNLTYATLIDKGALMVRPYLKYKMNVFYLVVFQMCFFMKKYHVLFDDFNNGLQRIIESGFMEKFVNDVIFTYSLKSPIDKPEEVVRLSFDHTGGVFIALLFGYAIAFVVFLCEHLFKIVCYFIKKSKQKYAFY